MILNKDNVFSESSYFNVPVYYDSYKKIYFSIIDDKEISEFYNKQYYDNFYGKRQKGLFTRIIESFDKKFNFNEIVCINDLNILIDKKLLRKKSTLLEIGCGNGRNVMFLNKRYKIKSAKGIEPDKLIFKDLDKKYFVNSVYKSGLFKEKFDIIYMRHVLEHVNKLDDFINEMKKDMMKNGIVYVNVPNALNKKILKISIKDHPHVYHFTQFGLDYLFESHGFKKVDSFTYDKKKHNKVLNILKKYFFMPSYEIKKDNYSEFLVGIYKIQ